MNDKKIKTAEDLQFTLKRGKPCLLQSLLSLNRSIVEMGWAKTLQFYPATQNILDGNKILYIQR